MNSSLCAWLAEVEEVLWRMVRGVFHFSFLKLPNWVYRALLDTVGPAVVRMLRVAVAFCIWLTVVFGPGLLAVTVKPPAWLWLVTIAWMALAIVGSVWGRAYLKKKLARKPWEDDEPEQANLQPIGRV